MHFLDMSSAGLASDPERSRGVKYVEDRRMVARRQPLLVEDVTIGVDQREDDDRVRRMADDVHGERDLRRRSHADG